MVMPHRLIVELDRERDRRRVSIPELADMLGVNPSNMYAYFGGRRTPPLAVLDTIARRLGVRLALVPLDADPAPLSRGAVVDACRLLLKELGDTDAA